MRGIILFSLIAGIVIFSLAFYIGFSIGETFDFEVKESAIRPKTTVTKMR